MWISISEPEIFQFFETFGADYKHELVGERLTTTPKHYAYLKISEGCDRPCSFCAIPLMRGGHVSTPIEKLVNEAETCKKRDKRINSYCSGSYLLWIRYL
jgi:tRNA A37 methylthiotransferase MiaB